MIGFARRGRFNVGERDPHPVAPRVGTVLALFTRARAMLNGGMGDECSSPAPPFLCFQRRSVEWMVVTSRLPRHAVCFECPAPTPRHIRGVQTQVREGKLIANPA